ncbi:MAG: tRNA preQ1(34) S-adenosylmethionine ribosyltransferase-isomerase QueA [Verrucomicrobia bacterium]|nr:tRNA preQ1(34) S-adenosylmethionine ribosyltransferase-isomerase QueA [Verrucomicrobiota bacterium]MBV8486467.1 tRNA preQ1(34) S-adenosylmethionine ribosyltransferase-isomerase QueA [Verrucomicrobiota bacterium]
MSFITSDYDYALPAELIALHPPPARDQSRMMVLDRQKQSITHHWFRDIPEFVSPEDLLVLNNTKVIPARIRFHKRKAELLLLEQLDAKTWRCLVRPGHWFRDGRQFSDELVSGTVLRVEASGERVIEFETPIDFSRVGEMPLPPYLHRKVEPEDAERYQTVFAAKPGAVAAPTAGLHFTAELLAALPHVFITLRVGIGTFLPVKTEDIREHHMHQEWFEIETEAAERIATAKRVLAVGTTTVRTLESVMLRNQRIVPGLGATDIFIYPRFEFRRVDSLLTNFHLPKSTLLMLVAAFAGREFILEAYREAVADKYRFFSYGDCMLIR